MLSRLKWFGLIPAPKFLFFTPISVSDYNPTIVTDSREHEVAPNTVVSGALFVFHIDAKAACPIIIWKKHDSHPEQVEKLLRGFFNWLSRDLPSIEYDTVVANFIYYVKRHEEKWDEDKGIINEQRNWETDKHLRKYLELDVALDTNRGVNARFFYHIYLNSQTADIYEGRFDNGKKEWVLHKKQGTINVGGTGNVK